MTKNNERFFLQDSGGRLVWDPVKNEVIACAVNGVFSTEKKAVAEELIKRCYPEVTAERLEELGYKQPARADKLDWNVRDDRRYFIM